ncbi:MAG: GNAT family N-acetyltransferase [Chitinophagaceae bacterium]
MTSRIIKVRIAAKEDAKLIADLSRETFYDTFAASNSKENMDKFMTEKFTSKNLRAEVGADGNTFLLAYYGEEPVGYARLRDNNNPPALKGTSSLEIARIYSIKKMIGKGVGKALMLKSIAIAKEKNKEVIWLGVWEKNETAFAFYKKWGFEKFAEHDFVLGNDVQRDWLLKKEL